MKMVGDEGYLLKQIVEGVAYDPPCSSVSKGLTWNV
jgi:hypothetical protein